MFVCSFVCVCMCVCLRVCVCVCVFVCLCAWLFVGVVVWRVFVCLSVGVVFGWFAMCMCLCLCVCWFSFVLFVYVFCARSVLWAVVHMFGACVLCRLFVVFCFVFLCVCVFVCLCVCAFACLCVCVVGLIRFMCFEFGLVDVAVRWFGWPAFC